MSNFKSPANKLEVRPGETFGLLTVLKEVPYKPWGTWVLFRCVCGKEVIRSLASTRAHWLTGASTPSCGCRGSATYKAKGTRPYRIWNGMKVRCQNPKSKDYARYGGRGITLCDEWQTFEGFWKDMAFGYADDLSIDRIDTNKGYCKENCRWATSTTQSRNKRNSATDNGVPLKELAEKTGINYYTLFDRYNRGDRGERLVRPVMKKRRKDGNNA